MKNLEILINNVGERCDQYCENCLKCPMNEACNKYARAETEEEKIEALEEMLNAREVTEGEKTMKHEITVNELEKNFGSVELNGIEYVLLEQAFFADDVYNTPEGWEHDDHYKASAIKRDDQVNADGYQPCYTVRWEILDEYDPEYDGEDCACDWDEPSKVEEEGEYNVEAKRYF